VIPAYSNKPIFGYYGMIYAMLSIGVLGFVVWAYMGSNFANFAICWNGLKKSVGIIEIDSTGKSDLLSNQQETLQEGETLQRGSSETYTQSSSKVKKPTEDSARPSHKKPYTKDYIDWLVGFTEGDGSFVINNETNKVSFIITQKDPKVLYHIKKSLGFGRIYKCADSYYRYNVSNKENLGRLIEIFKGQLRLEKTNKRFEQWVETFTKYYKLEPLIIERGGKCIDSKTAWLSGFIDAEGCFNAVQRSGRKTFRMRFIIKQKGEYEKLKELLSFAGQDNKWGSLTLRGDIAIHTVDSLVMLNPLIKYLEKYPLQSIKNVAFTKWLKLLRVIEDGGRGKDYDTIKTMAQNINQFEDEDKVHISEKDWE
jgi:hypothetical protein